MDLNWNRNISLCGVFVYIELGKLSRNVENSNLYYRPVICRPRIKKLVCLLIFGVDRGNIREQYDQINIKPVFFYSFEGGASEVQTGRNEQTGTKKKKGILRLL